MELNFDFILDLNSNTTSFIDITIRFMLVNIDSFLGHVYEYNEYYVRDNINLYIIYDNPINYTNSTSRSLGIYYENYYAYDDATFTVVK